MAQFALWAGDFLGALCESFALFAVKGPDYRKAREELPPGSESMKRDHLSN
jgi:hypothetical protein